MVTQNRNLKATAHRILLLGYHQEYCLHVGVELISLWRHIRGGWSRKSYVTACHLQSVFFGRS